MAAHRVPSTTVVIPVWDRYAGAALHEALQSVRTQEPARARILVVDNASSRPIARMDGVQLVRAPSRLTLGAARNLGLQHVETPYVIFWDADDLMLPGTLAALEAGLEADVRRVAFAMAIRESPSGRRHRWPREWIGRLVQMPRLLALLDCIWSQFPATGATIMRSDAVRDGGGYADADSGEDWSLGVSLAFRGRLGWSERPGRVYRVYPESVSARHLSLTHQRRHQRAVRARIRGDGGIPTWARALLPAVWLGQYGALGLHAVVAARRRWASAR